MNWKFWKKTEPERTFREINLRPDKLNPDTLSELLSDLDGLQIKKVLKPFYKITLIGSRTMMEIYPAFRKAKVYTYEQTLEYKNETDLATKIKSSIY